jgi:hypothetical protein
LPEEFGFLKAFDENKPLQSGNYFYFNWNPLKYGLFQREFTVGDDGWMVKIDR